MTGDHFLGVALTDDARRAVQARIALVELPGGVVAPEDWHLTVGYLGETSSESLERLRGALGTADLGPAFSVAFGGLGAFPDADGADVVWLGLASGAGGLHALAGQVNATVRHAGFPDGDPSFTPHVTLSRTGRPTDTRPLVGRFPPVQVEMVVDAVVLFRSESGSPRYIEVARYPLGRG